jgi:hypothetical protein
VRSHDERLVLNLLRGTGRSVGGDLDVGDEGSEQTIVTTGTLVTNTCAHELASPRRLNSYRCN